MNERLDLETRLTRFLVDEAPARAPERLTDAARQRLAVTRQNRLAGSLRWRLSRAIIAPVGAAAAALLVVAVGAVLIAFNGSGPSSGFEPSTPAPSPTSAPTPSPSPTASPYPCGSGPGTCLGTLRQGTYDSTSLLPGVRYAVPDGWANTADSRTEFELQYLAGGQYTYPDGIGFHDGIYIYRQPIAESTATEAPLKGVGATAKDLAQWLAGHDDLDASAPEAVTIGGAIGYRLTLSVPTGARTAPDHCTSHGVARCVSLFLSSDPAATWGFGLVGPETAVAYLLATPSGDTVLVVIDDVDGVDQPGLEAAALPVVNSLVFAP